MTRHHQDESAPEPPAGSAAGTGACERSNVVAQFSPSQSPSPRPRPNPGNIMIGPVGLSDPGQPLAH
jgi:hypothetical protein